MSDALIDRLARIVGPAHCLTDPVDLTPHLREERGLFQGQALCVVKPKTTDEVSQVVRLCAETGHAMVPQGGNTGLCGGGVPHGAAVVIATERLNTIRSIDPVNMAMTVEAGCILADIQKAAQAHDLLFPLSLGAEGSCRIGGNLSTNAGGLNVLRYGNARDLALGLEVVLPDGQVWNGLRSLRKDNTGYDLKHLFIGAEGTLGIITAATLRLYPQPRDCQTALVAIPSPDAALAILGLARRASGDCVTACELLPRFGMELWLNHLPNARDPFDRAHPWYLLLELSSARPGGLDLALEDALTQAADNGHAIDAVIAQTEAQRLALWRPREEMPEAQKREGGSIKHDVSIPTSSVPEFIRRAQTAVVHALPGARPVAFGHVGDGNIHFNITQPSGADRDAFLANWDRLNRLVHDIVVEMDGSFSAEHGIGQLKVNELVRLKPALDVAMMRKIKSALDPLGLMNPGKILN